MRKDDAARERTQNYAQEIRPGKAVCIMDWGIVCDAPTQPLFQVRHALADAIGELERRQRRQEDENP